MAAKQIKRRKAVKAKKPPTPRKTKYETNVLPHLVEIEAWTRDGATDASVAKKLNIAYSTFREYVKKYSALSAALKKSKELADIDIENALFRKAMGYNAQIKKNFKIKVTEFDHVSGKKTKEYEKLETAFDEVHVAADTTAQIFWLKNRKPEVWADKQESVNVEMSVEEYLKQKGDDFEY